MKYAAIALLLTSTTSASSEQVKQTLSTMSQKDLVALMGKLSQDPKIAKQIEGTVQLGETSDMLMNGWHSYTDWQEHNGEVIKVTVNNVADELPYELRDFETQAHDGLDNLQDAVNNALKPENIEQTRQNVAGGFSSANDAITYGVSKDLQLTEKFRKAFNRANDKSLAVWKQRKAQIDASAKKVTDAAEGVEKAWNELAPKLQNMPEFENLGAALNHLADEADQFDHECNELNEEQWAVSYPEWEKEFRHEFDHIDECPFSGAKKEAAPVSMIKIDSSTEEPTATSGYGWGSMTILASAIAGSAYMYNKAQKKTSDQFNKASEGLI